jgi:NAD(P) transhydrogenase subunit alpha
MMFARNITAFLTHLIKDQKVNLNLEDDIVRETLLTNGGEIAQSRVREFLKLPALAG